MKKLATLLIAVAIMLGLSQCKRNSVDVVSQNGTTSESIVNGNDAVKRIVKFKKMLSYYKSNPGIKDGETMSLSEAISDIENTFNATYSYSEDMYSESMDHEFILNLNVDSDGNVLLTDLATLYDQIVSSARNAYTNDGFENKIFISLLADVIVVNNNIAVIKIKAKTGERTNYNPPVPHIDGPFRPGDDYHYDHGTCINPCNSCYGADEMITEKLLELINSCFVEPQDDCRNIYINRKLFYFMGGPTGRPGMFYRTDTTDVCITSAYMNDYWNAEKRAIFVIIPEEEGLGTPLGVDITGRYSKTPPYITHYTEVEYGDRVEANIDEIGEIEDLLAQ